MRGRLKYRLHEAAAAAAPSLPLPRPLNTTNYCQLGRTPAKSRLCCTLQLLLLQPPPNATASPSTNCCRCFSTLIQLFLLMLHPPSTVTAAVFFNRHCCRYCYLHQLLLLLHLLPSAATAASSTNCCCCFAFHLLTLHPSSDHNCCSTFNKPQNWRSKINTNIKDLSDTNRGGRTPLPICAVPVISPAVLELHPAVIQQGA